LYTFFILRIFCFKLFGNWSKDRVKSLNEYKNNYTFFCNKTFEKTTKLIIFAARFERSDLITKLKLEDLC